MGPGPGRKLSLPANILRELEIKGSTSHDGRRCTQQTSRKEQRRNQRVQKRQAMRSQSRPGPTPPAAKPRQAQAKPPVEEDTLDHDESEEMDLGDEDFDTFGDEDEGNSSDDGKGHKLDGEYDKSDPGLAHPSKSVQRKLAQDDAEISQLEKRLGLRKGKRSLPRSFDEDGLGDLLGDLDGDDSGDGAGDAASRKRKTEADEWLAMKRQKSQQSAVTAAAFSGNPVDDSDDSESYVSADDDRNNDAFDGFSDEDVTKAVIARAPKENPYVAPTTGIAKYVPPSLRKPQARSNDQVEAQVRRRLQGLVNRLTSDSLVGVTKEVLTLYNSNPRQVVTSTLANILLALVCSPEKRPEAFFVMVAGFIAAVHRAMGTAVAAHLIQQLVQVLGEYHQKASGDHSDAGSRHLVTLLAELYNMQVVSCVLVFDYIRLFLSNLSELNTELLLRIIQHCGPSLRREDPRALSDIIGLIKPANLADVSVRTRFMIDEMKKLQSNKTKAVTRNRDLADHRAQAKKKIATLSSTSDSQPFRIGLKDIQNADKNGKWWLVGASWSGAERRGKPSGDVPERERAEDIRKELEAEQDKDDYFSFLDVDFWQLAKQQGFNTDVRQRIFVALQTATDYEHAELLVRNLRLNKHQRKEIPEVIVRSGERQGEYNHYYTLVASRFCRSKELAFQFKRSLAVRFGKMGEDIDAGPGGGYDADDMAEYNVRYLYNAARMYGALVALGALRLADVLKHRNLTRLEDKASMFVEVFLMTVLQEATAGNKLQEVLAQADQDVARGTQYFLRKRLRKTDLLNSKNERKELRRACEAADDILQHRLTIGEEGGDGAATDGGIDMESP